MAPRQQVQLAAVPAVYVAGSHPKVAVIHATAVFENCPSSQQEDVESLHRFLVSCTLELPDLVKPQLITFAEI